MLIVTCSVSIGKSFDAALFDWKKLHNCLFSIGFFTVSTMSSLLSTAEVPVLSVRCWLNAGGAPRCSVVFHRCVLELHVLAVAAAAAAVVLLHHRRPFVPNNTKNAACQHSTTSLHQTMACRWHSPGPSGEIAVTPVCVPQHVQNALLNKKCMAQMQDTCLGLSTLPDGLHVQKPLSCDNPLWPLESKMSSQFDSNGHWIASGRLKFPAICAAAFDWLRGSFGAFHGPLWPSLQTKRALCETCWAQLLPLKQPVLAAHMHDPMLAKTLGRVVFAGVNFIHQRFWARAFCHSQVFWACAMWPRRCSPRAKMRWKAHNF